MPGRVKAKKKCCKDDPRCKRCPVVLDRLEKNGLAERVDKRVFVVHKVPRKKLKAVRKR